MSQVRFLARSRLFKFIVIRTDILSTRVRCLCPLMVTTGVLSVFVYSWINQSKFARFFFA
jgi:hypothetical protein